MGRLIEELKAESYFARPRGMETETVVEIGTAISIVTELAEEYKLFGNSEQVNGGWIPSDSELPKEDERILCLHSNGFIDCGVLVGEAWCCDMDEYSVIKDDVHAWMPLPALPAPYTEGE